MFYSLLIVDDEKEIRDSLTNYFPWEKCGFKVVQSLGNANEAFEYVKKHPVDVILTDIKMPFMSGLDLIKKIKSEIADPIIFCLLSAHKDFDFARKGISLGVRHYLLKPTEFEVITDAFQTIKKE